MHMTGMESFNAASKRGALPMNSTASGMPSTIATSGDSQSQGKSNMRKSLLLLMIVSRLRV